DFYFICNNNDPRGLKRRKGAFGADTKVVCHVWRAIWVDMCGNQMLPSLNIVIVVENSALKFMLIIKSKRREGSILCRM
ncbi:unnamed protein product, partial [Linum tenue]